MPLFEHSPALLCVAVFLARVVDVSLGTSADDHGTLLVSSAGTINNLDDNARSLLLQNHETLTPGGLTSVC